MFTPRTRPPEAALWGLVPAAGTGARMHAGRPKQYLHLMNRPILQLTLERLGSYMPLQGIVVGIAPDDTYWTTLPQDLPKVRGTFPGGRERAHTVLNGLSALLQHHAAPDDWVLVHDAVRPCVRHADIDKLLHSVDRHPDGGLLGLPLTDTVKRVDAAERVLGTAPRTELWRALTPQVFPITRLKLALEAAVKQGQPVTDEATAIELAGGHPRMVAGHADNIKITLPADLALAEIYLKQQAQEPD